MRFLALAAALLVLSGRPSSAQTHATEPTPDGRVLRPGTDTLAVYFIHGTDTTQTGIVIDELQVIERDGQELLQRVYFSADQRLGTRLDSLVDVRSSLAPVSHRSRSDHILEFLTFAGEQVRGWMHLANGDSVSVQAPLPRGAYNSSSFDLVLRAASLREGLELTVPAFLPRTRSVVELRAKVAGREVVDGVLTWRVEAEFTGMPVTFWVDHATRALRRQTMQLRPDVLVLYTAPRARRGVIRAS